MIATHSSLTEDTDKMQETEFKLFSGNFMGKTPIYFEHS